VLYSQNIRSNPTSDEQSFTQMTHISYYYYSSNSFSYSYRVLLINRIVLRGVMQCTPKGTSLRENAPFDV